jgi:hypothetical protein
MKPILIVGIVLVIAGVAGLVTGRVSYTTKEKVLDLGPVEATAEKEHTIGIPEIAGVAALVAGIGLVVVGARRS